MPRHSALPISTRVHLVAQRSTGGSAQEDAVPLALPPRAEGEDGHEVYHRLLAGKTHRGPLRGGVFGALTSPGQRPRGTVLHP